MAIFEKPRATDIVVVFAAGGLLCGAAEGAANFALHGYRVPEIVWAMSAVYLAISLALCLVAWPLWRTKIGFVLGFFLMCAVSPYGLLLTAADATYDGYLTHDQGRWLCIFLALVFAAACTAWYLQSRDSAMRWSRRVLVSSAVLVALWFCILLLMLRPKPVLAKASSTAPNVIVIVVDTLRADHLSTYGYRRKTTPNIDRIAAEGVVFENAISPSSWTLPAHASLITGVYPHEHHTQTLKETLGKAVPTLGEEFLARGYRTAAFSANTYFFGRENGFGRGFQTFVDYLLSVTGTFQRTQLGKWSNQFLFDHGWYSNIIGRQSAADINRAALHWVDRGDRPFFLMLNYFDVHDPYIVPEGGAAQWGAGEPVPARRISESFNQFRQPTPQELLYEINQYDNSLLYVDSQIEALMQELRRRGLDRKTLLVITADHGEEFDLHGIVTHANALYFGEIHVPLIFWEPGTVPGGIRVTRPVSTVNMGATVLDIAGGTAPSSFHGLSLAAFWNKGDVEHWPNPVSELARLPISKSFPNYHGPMQSIVTGQWHYILGPGNHESLYPCCASGIDQNDVAASSDSKPVMSALRDELTGAGEVPSPTVQAATGTQ